MSSWFWEWVQPKHTIKNTELRKGNRCKTYCETTSCVEVNRGDQMRSLPNWSVEREAMKELTRKDCCCCTTLLLNSECKTRDNSPLSGSLRVLSVLIAIAVSFSASDFPHRTSKVQSTADKKWRNSYFIFKIQTLLR